MLKPFAPKILILAATLLLTAPSNVWAQSNAPTTNTDSHGTMTMITTDESGIDVMVRDARGVTTHFGYSDEGQLQFENAPERGLLTYTYDELGRRSRIDRAGNLTTRLTYDDVGRKSRTVWKQTGEDKIVTRYTYDDCDNGDSKLCRIRHNDHVTRYAYTADGQLAHIKVKLVDEETTETLLYSYEEDGAVASIRYPSGLKIRYHYDIERRLASITGHYETGGHRERFNLASNLRYDEYGRLEGFVHGNNVRTIISRNEEGRLHRMTLRKEGAVLDRRAYTWNDESRLVKINALDAQDNRRFGYDAIGRLIYETRGDGSADSTDTVSYAYDAVGNRLSRTENASSRNYSYAADSNHLVERGRQALSYDASGNIKEDRNGRRSFAYDPTNRMVAFRRNGELRATYDYDAQGRRIRKTLSTPDSAGTKSIRFVYDVNGRLVSETKRRPDRSHLNSRDIVWLGNLPIAQIERRVDDNGLTRHAEVLSLHTGHLGEPRQARDETGALVWQWEGDAFGADMGEAPAVDRDPDGNGDKTDVSLRFPGQYHDRESGLFYNHHRDYDPTYGRYMQSDPVGLRGGVNRYAYVGGDPINHIDPSGLYIVDPGSCFAISDGVFCRKEAPGPVSLLDDWLFYGTQFVDYIGNWSGLSVLDTSVGGVITQLAPGVTCSGNGCVDQNGNPVTPDGEILDEIIVTGTLSTSGPSSILSIPSFLLAPDWAVLAASNTTCFIGYGGNAASFGLTSQEFANLDLGGVRTPVTQTEVDQINQTLTEIINPYTGASARLARDMHGYSNLPHPVTGAVLPQGGGLGLSNGTQYATFNTRPIGQTNPGNQRLLLGDGDVAYYTNDHYQSFHAIKILPGGC